MSNLADRLRIQAAAFGNSNFWNGREPDQEEAGIINDLRDAADRVEALGGNWPERCVRMSTSLKPRLSLRRSSVSASRQDRTRSFTGSFWALIKRKTRLQQRLGAEANLAVGTRIVIVRTSYGVHVKRYIANVPLHNDFTVWEFSYNCNGSPFV